MRKEQLIKLILGASLAAGILATKVHALDLKSIHIKPPKEPQRYEVCDLKGANCSEKNAAEATLALIQGTGRVFVVKRTEQELQQTAKGLGFTAKK